MKKFLAALFLTTSSAFAQVTADWNPPALNSSEAVKRNDLNAELDNINTVKQAADTELTCLAGLTSATDRLAYFTGSGTCSLAILTSYARTLLDDADAATARATLGLIVGTDVQAFDADLSTWAGVSSSANGRSLVSALDYATMRTLLGLAIGTDVQAFDADLSTWATVTSSANGRSLVSAADYAAMRTLLSLVIGTNVQGFDTDLTTWASVTPSANGQSLVSAADYAAMRALLDLEAGTDFYSISAADTAFLSSAEIDTSAEIAAIVGDESGTGALVLNTSPTLTGTPVIGDGAGNDKLSFAEETSDPTCSAGDYFIWANSVGAKLKKCQDGTITDLAPAGGGGGLSDAYDRATDGTNTATASSNDVLKFRAATGLTAAVQSNDVTHGDNVLYSYDIPGLSAGVTVVPGSDYFLQYNSTAAAHRKVSLQNIFDSVDNLTADTTPLTTDNLLVRKSGGARSMLVSNFFKVIDGLTADTAPVAGDFIPSYDTSAATPKKIDGKNLPKMWKTTVTLASDNTVSTTALADVTGMSCSVDANTSYEVTLTGTFQTAATTTGIGLALNIPSGGVSGQVFTPTSTTAVINVLQTADDALIAVSTGVAAANTNYPISGKWLVKVDSSGGTIQLRQRSEIATSNTVLKAGTASIAGTIMTCERLP